MIYHKLPRTRDSHTLIRFGIYAIIFLLATGIIYEVTHYVRNSSSGISMDDNTPLVKVGNETIYYKDLSTELASYPNSDESSKEILTQKLITDSTILQGGQDESLIQLDPSFFNSVHKDYSKRIEMVKRVKELLDKNSLSTRGYVVAIWFRNNGYIGPKGLAASKDLARKKLNALHTEVAAGRMSILKAGEIIKNESSLIVLDIAYKNNAIFPFTIYSGDTKRITLNMDLDKELLNLKAGGVSDMYVGMAKDPNTGEIYE